QAAATSPGTRRSWPSRPGYGSTISPDSGCRARRSSRRCRPGGRGSPSRAAQKVLMAQVTLVDPSTNRPQLEDLSILFPRASALLGAARSRFPARSDDELARVAPDTDADHLLEIIDRDGGLVIRGLLEPSTVERIDR